MSSLISERTTCAASALTPGTVVSRVTRFLDAQNVARLLTNQLLAGAQLLGRGIRHEACADETVAKRSASHSASLTSVLRPGTFFTWAAFAKINSNLPPAKMCHTGFQ